MIQHYPLHFSRLGSSVEKPWVAYVSEQRVEVDWWIQVHKSPCYI
jgi:hypothetical protein